MDERVLMQFSHEAKALGREKSHSICKYCGCTHEIRLTTDGSDYLLQARADACDQYIRDIHSDIRAIKNRLGLEDI